MVAREREDAFTLAANLNTQATVAQLQDDDASIADLLRESVGLLAALRDTWSLVYSVFGLAGVPAKDTRSTRHASSERRKPCAKRRAQYRRSRPHKTYTSGTWRTSERSSIPRRSGQLGRRAER